MGWLSRIFPMGSNLNIPIELRYKHAKEAIEYARSSDPSNLQHLTLLHNVIDKVEQLLEADPSPANCDLKQLQYDMARVTIDPLDSHSQEVFNGLNAQLGHLALKKAS